MERRFDRRTFGANMLATLAPLTAASSLLWWSSAAQADMLLVEPPDPEAITTIILEGAADTKGQKRIGVQLYDVTLGDTAYPAVRSVDPAGAAAAQGIQQGMVLVGGKGGSGGGSPSAAVVGRIQKGPYPVVLQFYDLSKVVGKGEQAPLVTRTPDQALAVATEQQQAREDEEQVARLQQPKLSSRGAGLSKKIVSEPAASHACSEQVARGDTVQIRYEARVAAPGGPLYASSATTDQGHAFFFVLGEAPGPVVRGVEYAMDGMCVGEIREIDIPSALGFGPFGSTMYDVPGGVRLWWKVELVGLAKKQSRKR